MSNVIDEEGFEVPVRLLAMVRHVATLFVAEDIEDAKASGDAMFEAGTGAPVGITVNNDLVRAYDEYNGWRQPGVRDLTILARAGFPVNPWNIRRGG